MDKQGILSILREHQAELQARGVLHLRLHGSVARNQASAHSDIDLIADFDRTESLSLVDLVSLKNHLDDWLGGKVDLSPAHMLTDPVRRKAAREAVVAF